MKHRRWHQWRSEVLNANECSVDQELTYKIRFQNVGNDVVRTVVLRDELPEGLDLTTLVQGAASHPYQFRIEGERTLVWTFENINLIDSIVFFNITIFK